MNKNKPKPKRKIIIVETPQRSGKKQLTETKIVKHTGFEAGLKVKPPKPLDNVFPVEAEAKVTYDRVEQKTAPQEDLERPKPSKLRPQEPAS